jgi:site-specific recombinase XerD
MKRPDNPYRGFVDMLRLYHWTGARTSELAAARVGHFVRKARQIVIGKEKRTRTMREAKARTIVLSDDAFAIVEKLCKGRDPTDPIFTDPQGRAWTKDTVCRRFEQVRKRAGVRGELTVYSFRHLWVSDALMKGIDVMSVAKMAGTSGAMIEKVYGHLTADHLRDHQNSLHQSRKLAAASA